MPILNLQLTAQGRGPDGQPAPLPPAASLVRRGPCIQVQVGVAKVIAQQLLQQGKTVPTPGSGLAIIDTGAAVTCIDDGVARQLGLPVTNVVTISSASHAATQQNVYPAQIEVIGLPLAIEVPNAIGAPLDRPGRPAALHALLQRTSRLDLPGAVVAAAQVARHSFSLG